MVDVQIINGIFEAQIKDGPYYNFKFYVHSLFDVIFIQ
jgi:hypothetical protein